MTISLGHEQGHDEGDAWPEHDLDAGHDGRHDIDAANAEIRLRRTPPRGIRLWAPVAAGVFSIVVLGTSVLELAFGSHAGPPSTSAAPATRAVVTDQQVDPEALGKLSAAMLSPTVTREHPAPVPPAPASPPPNDLNASPTASQVTLSPAPAPMPSRDAGTPVDVAPEAIPFDTSLTSPLTMTDPARLNQPAKPSVRAAWDAIAQGSQMQRDAIDHAGTLVEQGEVPRAREILAPVVDAGNPVAAFALAETYDPARLRLWRIASAAPDAAKARAFYQVALKGGIAAASARIATLP